MNTLYFEKEFKTAFTRERTILNPTAHRKLETSNPSTSPLTIIIKSPLIIRENKPNVKKLIGRVNIVTKGLMKVLISAKTTATTNAVITLSILTPDCNKNPVIKTARVLITSLTSKPIFKEYQTTFTASIGDNVKKP
jgi:hypothetical protein